MIFKILVLVWTISVIEVKADVRSAFNQNIYKDALDDDLCEKQIAFLSQSSIGLQFIDASGRIPSGIMTGHINDMGDYYQCIGINFKEEDMDIQGKYCMMVVPLEQEIDWTPWPDRNITWPDIIGNITIPGINITRPFHTGMDAETVLALRKHEVLKSVARRYSGAAEVGSNETDPRVFPTFTNAGTGLTIAACVPKVCSPERALQLLQKNFPVNVTANEYYCRFPGDKPFETADYIAIAIFSTLAFLNVISTVYDLMAKFYCKRDYSESSTLFRSFSIYTNTRRLLTFTSNPGSLECIDGIRSISMMWVILGHTYSFTILAYIHNSIDITEWMTSFGSTLINAAPITVDTFFMLTGLLVVYTTVGKISRRTFVKSLHLFYLHRLLRMFPLLATIVLFQASLANHISDGPFWMNVSVAVKNCRQYWWSALLHVQNYVNPLQTCVVQTWYLSVDTQLYVVSPLILYWLWGHRRTSFAALVFAVLLSLVSSSIYSYMFNFSAALANFNRLHQFNDYLTKYYVNTLTRAPPFFVGMICGYMLHVYRDRKIKISRMSSIILWILSILMMIFCTVSIYPVMQPDHQGQSFDNFLNSYMRAIWAAALSWIIFACHNGYGGAVNWFLSLQMWKLPARLSFAMYLLHVSGIMIINGTWVKTHYFSNTDSVYRFCSDLIITFVFSFIVCITIDAPFSTLQKLMLGGGKKRPAKTTASTETIVDTSNDVIKTSL